MRIRQTVLLNRPKIPAYKLETAVFESCEITVCEDGYNRDYNIRLMNNDIYDVPGDSSALILDSYGELRSGWTYPELKKSWFLTTVRRWTITVIREKSSLPPDEMLSVIAAGTAYLSDDKTGEQIIIPAKLIAPALDVKIIGQQIVNGAIRTL